MPKINSKIRFLFLLFLTVATATVWIWVFEAEESGFLKIIFFNVGQGDSIFIETPSHRQILIDGGPDSLVLERLNEAMFFFDRSIDLIVLTHSDSDHLTGLIDVLDNYRVGHILINGLKKETAGYEFFEEMVSEKNIPITIAQAGQKIILENFGQENEIVLNIFAPDQDDNQFKNNVNDFSVVSQLDFGETEILLTGDIGSKVEADLISGGWNLESDILKLAHHGSKTSNSPDFIKAVDPEIVVISVGADNRYGHPHPETLSRLNGLSVYRTDQAGDITILTDGISFEIKTDR